MGNIVEKIGAMVARLGTKLANNYGGTASNRYVVLHAPAGSNNERLDPNCAMSLNEFAQVLGVNNPLAGYVGNADNIGTGFSYGHIGEASTTNNWPENSSNGQYYVSFINASDSRFGFQIFASSSRMYFRIKWVNWKGWMEIS